MIILLNGPAGLYTLDEKMTLRKSHENPEIIKLYEEILVSGWRYSR